MATRTLLDDAPCTGQSDAVERLSAFKAAFRARLRTLLFDDEHTSRHARQ